MRSTYQIKFGTLIMEYDNDVLYKLQCRPIKTSINENRTPFSDEVYQQVEKYLSSKRKTFNIKYKLNGTDFQKKVWHALLDIPYGQTKSYKEIAEAINRPNASRAVGNANNNNPLMIIVPCHRVIGSNGDLTGYAGGLEMKKALLEIEKNSTY